MANDLRDRVESVLRTHVAAEWGLDPTGIEVLAVADGIASVRLTGACSSCPGGIHVFMAGMEQALREPVPEVEFVEIVP